MKNNIKLHLSAPYVHYQNGQVERDIQHVMNKARTLMASINVPPKYWEYAITTACYLINRSSKADNKIPYEILFASGVSFCTFLLPWLLSGYVRGTQEE